MTSRILDFFAEKEQRDPYFWFGMSISAAAFVGLVGVFAFAIFG